MRTQTASFLAAASLSFALSACPAADTQPGPDASEDVGTGAAACEPCESATDCAGNAACLQIGGSDRCALLCPAEGCDDGQVCVTANSLDGVEVEACVPSSGSCTGPGCGPCGPGWACEFETGHCVPAGDAGLPPGQVCGTLVGPAIAACCHNCSGNCQSNGCYGGWWCDTALCRCQPEPAGCGNLDGGTPAGLDASQSGSSDAAQPAPDAGPLDASRFPPDASRPGPDASQPGPDASEPAGPDAAFVPITGTVGSNGGSVSRMFFAVTGDTRPNSSNDTANYPTAIITKIYDDIQAMNPRPQFVIATGDFMYASTKGKEADPQVQLYVTAMKHFTGTVFPVMGNHECDGVTADNCSGTTTPNYTAFLKRLITPLGKAKAYYSVPINALDNSWTAKLVVVACNDWDSTQQTWLSGELAKSTTFTIVTNHMPNDTVDGPCVADVNTLLAQYPYTMLLVGHTHTFAHYLKELVVGIGGAPLSGHYDYGYVTVEQLTTGGFQITQYDYATGLPVQSFPFDY